MAQLSDDCFAQGGRMMRTDEALGLLARSVVRVTESEPAPLAAALGRILAEDVVSPHDVPPHDNSAVDGYAVFFDDLDREKETTLPVPGRASAGQPPLASTAIRELAIYRQGQSTKGVDTNTLRQLKGWLRRWRPGVHGQPRHASRRC